MKDGAAVSYGTVPGDHAGLRLKDGKLYVNCAFQIYQSIDERWGTDEGNYDDVNYYGWVDGNYIDFY